jgi:cytochrome bd-type quinol oxidase subunit 1
VSQAVGAGAVLISLLLFTALYGGLMVVDIYLLRKYAQTDPAHIAESLGAY